MSTLASPGAGVVQAALLLEADLACLTKQRHDLQANIRRAAPDSASDVWKPGKYAVVRTELKAASACTTQRHTQPSPSSTLPQPQSSRAAEKSAVLPRKPLLIASPISSQPHGVVLFAHGFMMLNSYYSTLIEHIASHGYIVIAPQSNHTLSSADCSEELEGLSRVLDWLPGNLAASVQSCTPDLRKLVLVGHSRGGKVAYALSLGLKCTFQLKVSDLIAFDPVDGDKNSIPRVTKASFGFPFPTLLIACGLGDKCVVQCAPAEMSHNAFFSACASQVYHFIGQDAGHMDFLNDKILDGSPMHRLATHVCPPYGRKHKRAPMRAFAAGVSVAYLRSLFDSRSTVFKDIVAEPESVPDIIVIVQVKN
eukprot:jgi/Chlat1/1822/Chrsp138S00113